VQKQSKKIKQTLPKLKNKKIMVFAEGFSSKRKYSKRNKEQKNLPKKAKYIKSLKFLYSY
jgi:hypothetical protein